MIKKYFPIVCLLLLTAACRNGDGSSEAGNPDLPAVTPANERPVAMPAEAPPSSLTLADIAVYDDFSKLEPIFHKQTDTTYVINFWATWCKPCVEELPYFEQLHEAFSGQKVKVILISLDFPKQLESKLLPFIEKHDLQPEVIALTDVRQNEWIDKVDPQWSGAIPVTVIYRGEQRRFFGEQFSGYEELQSIVKELL